MNQFITKDATAESEYGVKCSMKKGLHQEDKVKRFVHPLESRPAKLNTHQKQMQNLRATQGAAGPMKLSMEKFAVNQAMLRHPCFHANNLARDILNGEDCDVTPEHVFSDQANSEVMGNPHVMMEHKLGLKRL